MSDNVERRITCDCGKTILKTSLKQHQKSKFHQLYMDYITPRPPAPTPLHAVVEPKDCDICYESKNSIAFFECKKCKNTHCYDCHRTIIKTRGKCPFCREYFVKLLPRRIYYDPDVANEDLDALIEQIIANPSAPFGLNYPWASEIASTYHPIVFGPIQFSFRDNAEL